MMSRRLRLPLLAQALSAGLLMAALAILPNAALAQLSGTSSGNAGSTCSGANNGDGFCGSSTQELVDNGTTFQSRYAWNINADVGVFSTRDTSGNAQHNVTFSATAPGGYRLDIATSRLGDINRINDASGCDGAADTSGVTGSTNVALSSGTLTLGDPGGLGNGGSTTSTGINQNSSAQIFRVSNGAAQAHSLTFTWNGSVRSNSCEAAVRQGEQNGSTSGCNACGYGGSPGRTQANDGHFVTVTYTSLCGNSTIDASVGEQCDQGAANGTATSCCTSTCQFRGSGQVCRGAAGVCDLQETCSGSSPTCPADLKSTASCRAAAGDCDIAESCNGVSNTCPADVLRPNGFTCRGSAGVCDVAETCNGGSPACPADAFEPATTECRGAAGDCDIAENCTGSGAACPADALEPATTECRGSAGACDVAESCTGSSVSCPADVIQPGPSNQASGATATQSSDDVGTADLAIDGNVDGDFANGSVSRTTAETEAYWDVDLGSVQAINLIEVWNTTDGTEGNLSAFHVFVSDSAFTGVTVDDSINQAGVSDFYTPGQAARPSIIDASRTGRYIRVQLTGGDALTLAEVRVLTGVVCRNGAGVCDADELCDGVSPACVAGDSKQTVECRGAAGVCDVAETCDGVADDCPTDAFEAASTECRASAGVCDVAESCTGSTADCPADAFEPATVECRASTDFCDAAESCTGSDADCPVDAVEPAGTECRPQSGLCDVAEQCDGVATACPADAVADTSTTCRGLQGTCDVAENCDGVTTSCPADAVLPNLSVCRNSAGVCDPQETCDGSAPTCPADAFSPNSTVCRNAADVCDVAETCTGSGAACPADLFAAANTECRASTGECDPAEACTGSSIACPVDFVSPDTDGDSECDLVDNCALDPNASQVDSDSDGDGDVCDPCTNVAGQANAARRKITIKKMLPPTGDDKLIMKGRVLVPTTPTINPVANGVRIILENANEQMLDVAIAGTAYNPSTRTGWRTNATSTRFIYKNGSPTPANPISGITLVTSPNTPGVYKVTVKGKNGDLAVGVGEIPVKGIVVLDAPTAETGQCGEWVFPSAANCRFGGNFSSVTCK